jgi:hypothetical protein
MRRIIVALLASGLLALPAAPTHAQGGGGQLIEGLANCLEYAGQSALPSLSMAQQFTPSGVGPYGWAPLTQPFGAGPIGPATMYSPPGLVAAYGPLGPGPTAATIAGLTIPQGGFGFQNQNLNNYLTTQTLLGLGGLQQAELGTLQGRYTLGGIYQTAAATWATGLSARAGSTLAVALALCLGQSAPSASSAAAVPGQAAPSMMPSVPQTGTMPSMGQGTMPGMMPGMSPGMMPMGQGMPGMMPGTMPMQAPTSSGQ